MPDTFKYSYKAKSPKSFSLAVTNTGYQQCDSGYGWGPGVRDHFLIHHIVKGKGRYLCGSQTYELRTGDTFLIYPNAEVAYYADEKDPWEYYWVGFNGAEVISLLKETAFTPNCPVSHTDFGGRLQNVLSEIYHAHGMSNYHAVRMTGLLYQFFSLLLEFMPNTELPSSDAGRSYARHAAEFIAYNYSQPIDVEDIAANVGISRSHLYRVFMKQFSLSPTQYLTEFRINRARSLLEDSNLSIAAVANSVGFEDQLYFSKVFKKVTGMAPSAYLKRRED